MIPRNDDARVSGNVRYDVLTIRFPSVTILCRPGGSRPLLRLARSCICRAGSCRTSGCQGGDKPSSSCSPTRPRFSAATASPSGCRPRKLRSRCWTVSSAPRNANRLAEFPASTLNRPANSPANHGALRAFGMAGVLGASPFLARRIARTGRAASSLLPSCRLCRSASRKLVLQTLGAAARRRKQRR